MYSHIIFGRRKVRDLRMNFRILFEEIIFGLRIQKIHVCFVIILNSRNIAPIVVQLIPVDSLQASVTNEDVLNQILFSRSSISNRLLIT